MYIRQVSLVLDAHSALVHPVGALEKDSLNVAIQHILHGLLLYHWVVAQRTSLVFGLGDILNHMISIFIPGSRSAATSMLILQMESAEAYEKLDDILKIADFEVLLVGPADLSASLGFIGQPQHPKVENVMVDVAQKIKGTGKALATTFGKVEDCKRWIGEGYRMMNVGSPLTFGTVGLKQIFAELREEFGP